MNPRGTPRWHVLAGLAGLVFIAAYAYRHREVLAVREALVCQAQYFTAGWPGTGRFLSGITSHLGPLATALALFLVSWLAGRRLLGVVRGRGSLLFLGIGLGAVSLAVLGMGLAGLLYPSVLVIAGIVAAIAGLSRLNLAPPVFSAYRHPVLMVLAGIFVLNDFLMCLYPEWYHDGLAWHLAWPERFILLHRISSSLSDMFSLFPFGGEMLYTAVMPFGGEESAKMVNLGCAVGAAGAIGRLTLRLGAGNGAGYAVGVLAFMAMPMGNILNGAAFTENFRVFLETLALAEVAGMLAGRGGSTVAGGILMGLALGTKYLAGPRIVFLALACALVPGGSPGRMRRPLAFFAVAFLAASPWLARGWLEGGTPFYPLGLGIFNVAGIGADELGAWVAQSHNFRPGEGALLSWLALPWDYFIDTTVGYYGTYTAGPLALMFIVLLAGVRAWPRAVVMVLALCAVEWLAWSMMSRVGRYLMPMCAALFALGGWAAGVRGRASRIVLSAVVLWSGFAMVLRFIHRCNLYEDYGLASYTLGSSGDMDMARARGFAFQGVSLPGSARVLLAGYIPPLGIGRPWVGSGGFNHPLLVEWARQSPGLARMQAKARQAGVTHVFLSPGEFIRHCSRGPGYGLTQRESRVLRSWLDSLAPISSNERIELLGISRRRG